MSLEQMEKTIEQMLAIQRQLQEGQLKLQETQEGDRKIIEQMLGVQRDIQEQQLQMLDALSNLIAVSNRHERHIQQLIGYSITSESDRLDLLERVMKLEERVKHIEQQQS